MLDLLYLTINVPGSGDFWIGLGAGLFIWLFIAATTA